MVISPEPQFPLELHQIYFLFFFTLNLKFGIFHAFCSRPSIVFGTTLGLRASKLMKINQPLTINLQL